MRRIYFDNNATTRVDPQVREAMLPCLDNLFGNPSSGHGHGEAARVAVESARSRVAELLHCRTSGLVFTSGGSEANNLAIWSAAAAQPEKRHIISSQVEHPSVLAPLMFMQQHFGYEIELLPVDRQGALDLASLKGAIRRDTALVSLMGANNETGVLWPVDKIGAICRERRVLFHCDAVQMVGKVEVNLAELPVDYLSVAGHKLHGPKGVGLLYGHRSAPVTPLIMGSGQENGRRAGTENVPGIVGLGKACEVAGRDIVGRREAMKELRDFLEKGIVEDVADVLVNGQGQPRLPNTLNVSFRYCSSAALIQELDTRGIAVSAHSACQSGDLDPSHVLAALDVPEDYRHGTMRISLSHLNTKEEVDLFLEILPGLIEKSRAGFAL